MHDACSVPSTERARLEGLVQQWYQKVDVGDGADPVDPEDLDEWQRFAYDVAMDDTRASADPLRMMLLGGAGTGKSRTVRSIVGGRRERARRSVYGGLQIAAGATTDQEKRSAVKNSCLLAAPTGCASFQLKYGATTVHRAFGVPVQYCGPASRNAREGARFRGLRARLTQARLFVIDELSMVGRGMLGKIEYKVRDTLGSVVAARGEDGPAAYLAGKDAILSGDWKQAPPIGDEPMYRQGAYKGKGQNKPKGAPERSTAAWSTSRLAQVGTGVRDSFEDVALLRRVHRITETRPGLSSEAQAEFKRDAGKFLEVTRGMADCAWTKQDHAWLERRNRSLLQQTPEGRAELRRFDDAPLLMDGRKDRVTGEVGANTINRLKLEKLSADTQKPIAVLPAFHDKGEEEAPPSRKKPRVAVQHQDVQPELMASEDFRGIENEVCVCEGARVLLTQNLWPEAGLMNGAIGTVVGYMWPQNHDAHSDRKELRAPICVFVEFESVDMGKEPEGRPGHEGELVPRTFFPGDAQRKNWVPIFRQEAWSTAEDNLRRANFPLTLAWALTHWKAQGMTLDRVRVHLSARTAAAAGIGFVACTRVRHPWDLVFEEDLPSYEDFMRARLTQTFRERRRYELRCQARASRTLRRYGYCRGDVWSEEERAAAASMIEGLKEVGMEMFRGLRGARRVLDNDSWVWGDVEPDYAGELARQVDSLAAGDGTRRLFLERVAQRLLDRVRVRELSRNEMAEVSAMLDSAGGADAVFAGVHDVSRVREVLRSGAEDVAGEDRERLARLRELAEGVARRVEWVGRFDGRVVDGVPEGLQPLHMPAVKEALRALIPERLHGSLDKAVSAQKDQAGTAAGASFLSMDEWRVSVRAEEALQRGRLGEDVLEFMVRVLRRTCEKLRLLVAIASKTVGKEVGRQESPESFAGVFSKWKKVWDWQEVRSATVLFMPVAVDERAQDWLCVAVRSATEGQCLGDATRLRVCVHDEQRRRKVAERIARNVDALVRSVAARRPGEMPEVEFADRVPPCRVSSQRILCAFGVLLGLVADAAGERGLDASSEAFVPDVSHVLRAAFVKFRARLDERGARDVSLLLTDEAECRNVLRAFGHVPSLAQRRDAGAGESGGPGALAAVGRGATACRDGGEGGSGRAGAGGLLRVATWNVAGGLKSAQAPGRFSDRDQRAAVVAEIMRWRAAFRCDVVALQECEHAEAMEEFSGHLEFVGSAEAKGTRGFVHLYVRPGLEHARMPLGTADPCVAAAVKVSGAPEALHVVAVHLPSGDRAAERRRVLTGILGNLAVEDGSVLVVGDCNVRSDELDSLCEVGQLRPAMYAGATWGVSWNKFDKDQSHRGLGLRFDQALFGRCMWAEAHVVAKGRVSFEGQEFCMSDHFGLMVYVDVGNVFASRLKADQRSAMARRKAVAQLKEQAQQKEEEEVKARRQAAQEERAVARQRAAERGRQEWGRAQQRGARARRERRADLQRVAFGGESLFAPSQTIQSALGPGAPSAASEVVVPGVDGVGRGAWESAWRLPRVGMANLGNTCYVASVAQVLLRTPGVLDWVQAHGIGGGCARARGRLGCVVCALQGTLRQMQDTAGKRACMRPAIAVRRAWVHEQYSDRAQHDAGDFLAFLLQQASVVEEEAGRWAFWSPGAMQTAGTSLATHVNRLFSFVREVRRRCTTCQLCRVWYEPQYVLSLTPGEAAGGPETLSEMYLRSCGPQSMEFECAHCGVQREHTEQARVGSAPNVLVVCVTRRVLDAETGRLERHAVSVEEDMELPGFPRMKLSGVLYHNGDTASSGHYTCVCRGPEGVYWSYDDTAVRPMHCDVASIRPTQVHMAVYVRVDGRSVWRREAGAASPRSPEGAIAGAGQGVQEGAPAAASNTPRRLKRKARVSWPESPVGRAGPGGTPESATRRLRGKTAAGVPAQSGRSSGEVGAPSAGMTATAQRPSATIAGGVISRPARADDVRGAGGSGPAVEQGLGTRIMTGFGSERVADLSAHQREREMQQMQTALERSREGTGGAAVDMHGHALDRSQGGAWHLGR